MSAPYALVVKLISAFVLVVIAFVLAGSSVTSLAAHATPLGTTSGWVFVPAGAALRAKCRTTARSLGYRVPCLRKVPKQMAAAERPNFIGQGPSGPWRRWAVGSSYVGPEHLVATASPRPLANYAKVVNGPAWYPKARVRPLAWVRIHGWRMRAVYVPPDTNDGSAFAHHVVLIWTVGQHTYGIGFHNLHGLHETLRLDEELTRHVELVGP